MLIALVSAGLACNAVAACAVWPHALSYTNAAWGGTREGYRWLSDSNYDWGHGLLDLEAWCAERNVSAIDVWYFGTDMRVHAPPLRLLALHHAEVSGGRSPAEVVQGKIVAVSTTILYGASLRESPHGRAAAALFRETPPMGRTATFFIYDFRQEL